MTVMHGTLITSFLINLCFKTPLITEADFVATCISTTLTPAHTLTRSRLKMTRHCLFLKITPCLFTTCWNSASRGRKSICPPGKEKTRPVRAGNKSLWYRRFAASPTSSPLSSLCGAVSLLAFLSEKGLCSGWQSWVSAIENLVKQSEGEGLWLSFHSLSMDGSESKDEGGHKTDDNEGELHQEQQLSASKTTV